MANKRVNLARHMTTSRLKTAQVLTTQQTSLGTIIHPKMTRLSWFHDKHRWINLVGNPTRSQTTIVSIFPLSTPAK